MSKLFQSQSFLVDGSDRVACVIAGYRGKVSGYQGVIKILNGKGYSVIAYEHSPTVLTDGDPQQLPQLVNELCDDFKKRSKGYEAAICLGASIGAGLCFEVQRRVPSVQYGVYAGAGVSPAEAIFEAPLFYFVRRKFARKRFNLHDLKRLWQDIDITPKESPKKNTPFLMVLGKKDKIVTYQKALHTFRAWQDDGVSIEIITRPNAGHHKTITWYKKHIDELLVRAEATMIK